MLAVALLLPAPASAADGDTVGGTLWAAPNYVSAQNLGNVPAYAHFWADCGTITPADYYLLPGERVTPTSTAETGYVYVGFGLGTAGTNTVTLGVWLGSLYRNTRLTCKTRR
jgi:hypothetical protein